MKKLFFIIIPVLSFLIFSFGCEEVGPNINLGDNIEPIDTTIKLIDTTYIESTIETPQTKNILLEEFTGVRCVNCPTGHEIAEDLKSIHGARFLSISYHSDFLDDPYSFSTQDLGNDEAQDMEEFLSTGQIPKPQATIDRRIFPGETEILYFTSKWVNYVDEQITNATTPVNVHLSKVYDDVNKSLTVEVGIHYTSEITETNNVSIFLIENDIVTAQLGHNGIDNNYLHNDVFRKALTNIKGDVLQGTKEQGRVYIKQYLFEDFDATWKTENMEIFAFVHTSGTSKLIYQAKHIDVN